MKQEYISARVPMGMREAFEKKFPPPEPDAPTAAQMALYPDGPPPQMEQGRVSKQEAVAARPSLPPPTA
jgi:hypothetical protein